MSDNLTVFGTDFTGVTGIKAKNTGNGTFTYIRPNGTKTIGANGTGIDVAEYASVDVSVPSSSANLQAKTNIAPSTSSQTITPDSGYDGLSSVQIDAVTTAMLAADNVRYGKTVTIGVSGDPDSIASVEGRFSYQGAIAYGQLAATSAQILDGYSAFINGAEVQGSIASKSSSDLTASGDTVTVPSGYYASQATKAVASGSATPASSISATGASVSTGTNTLTLSKTVSNTPQVSAGYVANGTAGNSSVSLTASINTRSSSDLTASGDTVTVPSGYYASQATKAVASGSAGTPSASKGAVSNHAVSVTPSVTNTAGYISGGTKTGTAVSVSASELVSGNLAITDNGTDIDVTNYATVSVAVEGGGSASGLQIASTTATPSTAGSSIQFTGLKGQPTTFSILSAADLATGASPYKAAAVVYDGSDLHAQTVTNTSNSQANYDSTTFTQSYSNGTLTVSSSSIYFQAVQYKLVYTYGGGSANIGTAETQVGSGATSITFTNVSEEPDYFSVIFKSSFSTSSGYQRVMAVVHDGNSTYGLAMDSGAKALTSWSYTYNNGSLTVSSTGTNNGGYFHQPGYYQLTYAIGGEVEPIEIEIEPLSVTQNGTYTAPIGTAYSPVTVNVAAAGGASIDTKSLTNASNTATSLEFTSMNGRPDAFFLRCTSQIQSSGSTSYYYVDNMRYNGTNTQGTYVRIGSTRGIYPDNSHYSYSYSGTTLTVTTSGSRTASGGSFYNGTYELVYIY